MASCTSRILCFIAIVNTLPDFKGKIDLLSELNKLQKESDVIEQFASHHYSKTDFLTSPELTKERDAYLQFENQVNVTILKLSRVLSDFSTANVEKFSSQLESFNDPGVLLTPEQAVQTGINIANKALDYTV